MSGMHLLPGEASKILRRPLFSVEVELNGASHLLLHVEWISKVLVWWGVDREDFQQNHLLIY